MTADLLIHNALIVNEGARFRGWVAVTGGFISAVGRDDAPQELLQGAAETVDAQGRFLLPGAIDEHVHFRDPGLTHKADMACETAAAAAGGVTSFIDMPNTIPQSTTRAAVADKMHRAAAVATANYGFYIGATNDNIDELTAADFSTIAGVKLFLGSSTGNMLVDSNQTIRRIFEDVDALIAVHAESEAIIAENRSRFKAERGDNLPVELHPLIRSRRACFEATKAAVEMARATGARLHVLHISTADELALFTPGAVESKRITAETCPQYLLFDDGDYAERGARVKCNPAIKSPLDRAALLEAVATGRIDCVATDHAPHLLAEKQGNALTAVSGMPMIQFSLPAMLTLADEGAFTIEKVVETMAHNPARLYGIVGRGFIRQGCYADLALVERADTVVSDADVLSRCGWTPLAGIMLRYRVASTWLNGRRVWDGHRVDPTVRGMALRYCRKP
nr:dihydroorotase [Bacteroides sp.]